MKLILIVNVDKKGFALEGIYDYNTYKDALMKKGEKLNKMVSKLEETNGKLEKINKELDDMSLENNDNLGMPPYFYYNRN